MHDGPGGGRATDNPGSMSVTTPVCDSTLLRITVGILRPVSRPWVVYVAHPRYLPTFIIMDEARKWFPFWRCSVFVPELAVSLLGQGDPILSRLLGEQEPGNSLTNTLH